MAWVWDISKTSLSDRICTSGRDKQRGCAVGPYPKGDKKARTNTRDFICKKPTKSSGKPACNFPYISRLL